jgi:hypothetical protein
MFIPPAINGKTPDNYLLCGKNANKKFLSATDATPRNAKKGPKKRALKMSAR